ncbi:hypothetical protein DAPPUDRAFT_345211 [Daphnia pulex]|uniref:Uncharacterized protein n=1 Tax=Daphnia pulex TaxID=6669 RepID=E9I795_DAPPU|nr:hypothetical protein DAPPUDRAFT_345211 [Daphnia pulex]|eukprot:EFX60135.1 hypothetical protein DAPPUDRAFT_345211 [Daphnia pulex]
MPELISVYPTMLENGDKIIDVPHLSMISHKGVAKGIIIRTLPNDNEKLERQYSETNPPYITNEAMKMIVDYGYDHLMIDTPSVDREYDEDGLYLVQNQIINVKMDAVPSRPILYQI